MGLHKYPSRLVVLGCFHSAPRRKEDQTDRYLAALRNPAIQILGHPRGRMYNFRLGLKADWPRVLLSRRDWIRQSKLTLIPIVKT